MTRRIWIIVIIGCLLLAAVAYRQARRVAGGRIGTTPVGMRSAKPFTGEPATRMYDCTLTLTAAEKMPAGSVVRLALEAGKGSDATEVVVTPREIRVSAMQQGRQTAGGSAAYTPVPGTTNRLTILRRGEQFGIFADDTRVFTGVVPPAPGEKTILDTGKGWKASVSVQPREPVVFADDFMRTTEESGGWKVRSGQWRLHSTWDEDPHGSARRFDYAIFAQNAFAWQGSASYGTALCTVGQPGWDDYTFAAAVRPGRQGAVGLAVNLIDANNGFLIRWSPVNDPSPQGNRLQLLRLENSNTRLLAESAGGYLPGQWYRLSVASGLAGVRVSIDGRERLAEPVTPIHGGVGLYVEGGDGATFDDVTVYGSTLNTDLIAESEQLKIARGFLEDAKGMKQWVHTPDDWQDMDGRLRVNRFDFFGEHWMALTVTPADTYGTLIMRLNGNDTDDVSGQYAVIDRLPETSKVRYTLYRDSSELASATGEALHPGEEYSFRFRSVGKRLILQRDGETVLQADDPAPVTDHRPAYLADGCFADARDILLLGRNYRDYTFATAPVDWVGEGTWMATTRWACQPKWSFYSGWSRGDAVLWHKNRFTGDQSLQVYMGFRMEYPREHFYYDQRTRYHDACITICGDGRNPRSGYALASGLPDANGTPNARTVLYRNGVVVRESPVSVKGWGGNHFTWYDMELRKRGTTVEFLLAGQPVISYRDPHPLPGGVPAIWTTDNGLSIARARIHCENPPALNTDPRVYLDDPWFPEWADLGRPLPLDFPDACSTTGKPVRLQVEKRQAPAGEGLPAVAGTRVVFTPGKTGSHWYQVRATDGQNSSPAFNFFLPVYNPALGRDDSHAILLYYFDEKTGSVVRDRSGVAPAADLQLPGSGTQWLPAQGLVYRGPKPLRARSAGKLMAIKTRRACTLEFWIATDSVHPATHWLGSILAWETKPGWCNFQVGMHTYTFLLAPPSGHFRRGPTIDNFPDLSGSFAVTGLRTGLQHMVITWDGAVTRAYANGAQIGQSRIPWETDRWSANAPLLLGNQTDEERNYLGTYYLLALHDTCLSPAQIRRHYLAGPGAR